MPHFLSLVSFTEQGLRQVKDSPKRANAFRGVIEKAGGAVHGMYWAVGEFDGALLFEVPDEETAMSLLLKLGSAGFVRTRTMRLLNAEEFGKIAQSS